LVSGLIAFKRYMFSKGLDRFQITTFWKRTDHINVLLPKHKSQQQNPYNLKTNQCFCFDFFHVVVLVLLAKQQQQMFNNVQYN
jgi:hypothetical protein